MRLVTSIIAAR